MSKSIGGKDYNPQTLDETLLDLKRIGKGLLVGETADILGLPADLIGLYYDVRYGETPQGIQSLIDTIGSEALAKKFMGESFPEFGMNLESAGRVMAPGALLTKAIASARLAARLKDTLPPGGGIGDLATETVGVGRVDDVPRTLAENLAMTRADDTGGPKKIGNESVTGEDEFFKDKVDVEARLNVDGTIFSNLINEIAKDGLGIDFTKPKKASEIKEYIETLPKSIYKSRLNAEALESGLFRYLENNPKEIFKSKDDLLDIASLFKPSINVTVGTLKKKQQIQNDLQNLVNERNQLDPSDPRVPILNDQIKLVEYEKDLYDRRNLMSNESAQRIPVGLGGGQSGNQKALVEEDTVHFIFHGDESDAQLMGKVLESDPNLRTKVDKDFAKVEDYFKSVGNTTALRELTNFKRHGFGFPGYMAHARAVGVKSPNPNDPMKPFNDLVVNEIQSNQAGVKEISLARDNKKLKESIKKLEQKMRLGTISPKDQKTLDLLKRKMNKPVYGDMMTNEKRADAFQIIKEDEKLKTGFFDYSKNRAVLTDNATKEFNALQQAETNLDNVEKTMGPFKEAIFKTDSELNEARMALTDYRRVKNRVKEDLLEYNSVMDVDYEMPKILASLMNLIEGRKAGQASPHFSMNEFSKILDYKGNNMEDFARNFRKISKERYGLEGDLDPLIDIIGGQRPEKTQQRLENHYRDKDYGMGLEKKSNVKDYDIIDPDMAIDHYEDLTKGVNEGKINRVDFEKFTTSPGTNYTDMPTYSDYVAVKKAVYGDDAFTNKELADRTLSYILNDKERKLELNYLKAQAYNKFINHPKIAQDLESDNILEIATRLEDLRKRQPDFTQLTDSQKLEFEKIQQDFETDFDMVPSELFLKRGKDDPGSILQEISKEVMEQWMSGRGNQKPRIYSIQGRTKYIAKKNELSTYLPRMTKSFFKGDKATFDRDEYLDAFDKASNIDSLAVYLATNIARNELSNAMYPLNAMIAKKNLMNMEQSIKHLEEVKDAAVDRVQEANRRIEEFDANNDKTQILNELKSKLPDNLKDSLDVIVRHQEGIEKLNENPAFSNSKQATELMVHQIINQARKLGYDRVIFPNVESYLKAGRTGEPIKRKAYGDPVNKVPYNFAIGSNVTDALKKYGSSYTTQPTYKAFKKGMVTQANQPVPPAEVNFGQQSRQNPVEDDMFRIIDLNDKEAAKKSTLKIPRMAKGGILNRFRKAS
tara:strand:- start:1259 stop:4909 length:3651 start_codon:yes stop_codon:yes gene_type:complete